MKWTLLLAAAAMPITAWSHDPGLSNITVDLSTREILVQGLFAKADLANSGVPSKPELAAEVAELRAAHRLAIRTVEAREAGATDMEFTLRFPRPAGQEIVFRTPMLARLPAGHRTLLTIRDESGATVRTELLSAGHDSLPLPVAAVSGLSPLAKWSVLAAAAAFATLILGWLIRQRPPVMAAL